MSDLGAFDPRPILRVLVAYEVRFVVIGALAATMHGSPIRTGDADITPARNRPNLDRLARALTKLDARVRTADQPEGFAFPWTGEAIARVETWNLVTRHGDLDVSMVPSGTQGYEDLRRGAVTYDIGGIEVMAASLLDVIRSKEAADRPKDRAVLPALRKLLAYRAQLGEP